MKKFKKIFLVISTCFIAVFSLCFGFLGNTDTLQVKADSITEQYSFNGSNTLTLPVYYTSGNGIQEFLPFNFQVSFYTVNGQTTVTPNFSYYTLVSGATGAQIHSLVYSNSFSTTTFTSFNLTPNVISTIYSSVNNQSMRSGAFRTFMKCTSGFNSNVYKIRMYMPSSFQLAPDHVYNYSHPLHVEYYDVNDNKLIFEFAVPTTFVFSDRTYYTTQDFSDSQIYNQGYSQGLLDNQINIYNDGYNAGNTAGYNNGYNAGLNDSNEYSFFNLFGAVLDAPIQTLIGLFNFQLFGVNLWSLFTALLTLAIILLVLRLIRGGK